MTGTRLVPAVFTILLTLGAASRSQNLKCHTRKVLFEVSDCDRRVDVAIVGAGPGGAYAAYKLRNTNQNVELFEYSDRIGGRLYTTFLPNIPDVPLDAGGMRFIPEVHQRVQRLVEELDLSAESFSDKHGDSSKAWFYLKGQGLSAEELLTGAVPYDLSPDEKAHQGDIIRFYLQQMTGYNGSKVKDELLTNLTMADGRYLYTVPFDEAFDTVASRDGKAFMRAIALHDSLVAPDSSPVRVFENSLGRVSGKFVLQAITQGMSALPGRLVKSFLRTSRKNRYSRNRQLVVIHKNRDGDHLLLFRETKTHNGETFDLEVQETVCAGKVVLAISKFALAKLEWEPLKKLNVREAIDAVREVKASKIFLSFPSPWWLVNATYQSKLVISDLTFHHYSDWGRSAGTGAYVMLASFAEESKAELLKELNMQGNPIIGSPPGSNAVSDVLVNYLLDELALVFGSDRSSIPEPLSALSQFWDTYPFGGGWILMKAGYRYDDVIATVTRPSKTDDVFIVGSDYSKDYHWMEGALATVDNVFERYFR